MIRGTTPLHTFTLPFEVDVVDKVRVIYSQNDEAIIKKDTEHCTCEGNCVKVKLTQEDTLTFNCSYPVDIQVRVLTKTGDVVASLPERVAVDKCLENEVLK